MKSAFSRRGPDIVTEELAAVLSRNSAFEFKPLFDILHANLRARNAANGGEEMLRLRAYEKLQVLVQQGVVRKVEKKYKGVPAALTKFIAAAAEANLRPAPQPISREPAAPAAVAPAPAVVNGNGAPKAAVKAAPKASAKAKSSPSSSEKASEPKTPKKAVNGKSAKPTTPSVAAPTKTAASR